MPSSARATTVLHLLSLHDALPISAGSTIDSWWSVAKRSATRRPNRSSLKSASRNPTEKVLTGAEECCARPTLASYDSGAWSRNALDRKSTRLNSSHEWISYAVFSSRYHRAAPPFPTRRSSDLSWLNDRLVVVSRKAFRDQAPES